MNFNSDFCQRVHNSGLELLKKNGVKIDHEKVKEMVIDAGAKEGSTANTVLFPEELVKEKLSIAPPVAKYADQNLKVTELSANGPVTFWTGAALNIREWKEQGHAIKSNDLANIAKVNDNLKNVFAVTGTSIADIAPEARDYTGFRIIAQNTKKHIRPLMFTKTGVKPIIEMVKVLLNGKKMEDYPIFSLGYSILSPFHWGNIAVNMWYESRGYKIPVMINGEPIAGATSPITLAGSITQSNAEILSGIIINQIIEPERPCVYNLGFAHIMDMKTMLCLSGSPECALMAEAGAYMAKFYNFPSASWMSTDSIYGNYQGAVERMMTGFIQSQAGINIIWGIGQLESQKSISLTQCVLDNDLVGYIKKYNKGFDLSDEAMALNEILNHGFKGNYIESSLTLAHCRDLYEPEVFMRRFHNQDKKTTEENMKEIDAEALAQEKVRQMTDRQTSILTPEIEKQLLKIESDANSRIGLKRGKEAIFHE